MDLYEIIDQVVALLQKHGRATYRALKLQFHLDDEHLEALKEELIEARELALDKDGKVLVWTGGEGHGDTGTRRHGAAETSSQPAAPNPQSPASYTPPHLVERVLATQAALEARNAPDGERKTITALFADLKGSTALIEDLDPEDARRIIDPALQLMMDAVHRYEGYVAQSLGDGIFALFGAPIAHEDHPQRALYAALRMQEEIRRHADTLRRQGHAPLHLRVGVNTGEVVLRSIRKDDLHTDYVPVGHSTNLAARMEQLASPGSILVTEYTRRLTEGFFAFKSLGATQIKGVAEPLPVYEVLGAGPLRTRLQVAVQRGLTRFVGRQTEMEVLRKALDQAKSGHGQIVGVMGEPGVGKSRLFHEFKLTSQTGCLALEAYSVSHGKASPYLPLIELLKSYFQITPQDDDRRRREKVGGKVLMLDRSLEDTLPYLFALLGIDEQTAPLQQMDPQIRRKRTFDAIKQLLLRESQNQPLLLFFEDLHWLDAETQAFLLTLSESLAAATILLLVNYRPEYRHEWGNKTYYTQLRLDALGPRDADDLLTDLLGTEAALPPLKQLIRQKTEGNPFFIEEVVQTLVEEQVLAGERGRYQVKKSPSTLHISPTVQGVLAARMDRLGAAEKELLQHLAVIGREFSLSLLQKVAPRSEAELYQALSHLQAGEFIYEQSTFPDVEYIFKHALTQEVAYNSMLVERRKLLHERVAQAIEGLFPSRLEDYYSELAQHYSRSSNTRKAVEYLQLAGQQAVQRSANAEAVSHLTTALELLKTLPDTPERTQQELTLQTALGVSLIATKGFAAPEVEKAYTRARELCQQVGETPQLFPVLEGLCAFYAVRAELRTARELGEQLLSLAQSAQDPALLLAAHHELGFDRLYLGELASGQTILKQGSALYDPQQHRSLAFLYVGHDPGVCCLSNEAVALWLLGYPDQALKRMHEALSLAQELSHPFSLALALCYAACLRQFRGEGQATQEQAEAAIDLATEQGFPFWVAWSNVLHGWALAVQRQEEEGIAQMRQGMAVYRNTGAELNRPYFLSLLAKAYERVGQPAEKGLSVLAEALAAVDKNGERVHEAELYRLKGELVLQSGLRGPESKNPKPQTPSPQAEAEAEACFLKAIDIARKQQAKSLELRAVMSLSRLWQHQDKKVEARQMLGEVYGWFTEGFDTKDLQEAKALLEELKH